MSAMSRTLRASWTARADMKPDWNDAMMELRRRAFPLDISEQCCDVEHAHTSKILILQQEN